jgi:hypothetical protein
MPPKVLTDSDCGPHNMPFLTLHRPNFCAECGARILRLRWRVWTSRRFCDTCVPKFRKQRLTASVLIAATFVLGILIGRSLRPPPPPLTIVRKEIVASPSEGASAATVTTPPSIEEIYTCGARTKKGKPCSRRVHGPVRCWQHKGMPAMVSQEKLKIKE